MPRKGARLRTDERERIALLAAQGLSKAEIAREIGCSRDSVYEALKTPDAQEVGADVKALLRANRAQFVEDWKRASAVAAARGDHRPAMMALERLKEIEPPSTLPNGAPVNVQIGVVIPGLPQPITLNSR